MAGVHFKPAPGNGDHTLTGFWIVYYDCCPFTGELDRPIGSLCRFKGKGWAYHSKIDYEMVFNLPGTIREEDEVAAKLAIRYLFGDTP